MSITNCKNFRSCILYSVTVQGLKTAPRGTNISPSFVIIHLFFEFSTPKSMSVVSWLNEDLINSQPSSYNEILGYNHLQAVVKITTTLATKYSNAADTTYLLLSTDCYSAYNLSISKSPYLQQFQMQYLTELAHDPYLTTKFRQ